MAVVRRRSSTVMHSNSRRAARAVCIGVLVIAAACGSTDDGADPNTGPNPTTQDPGPNTTVSDPGPNPTDAAPVTLSGTLQIDGSGCAQLVADDAREFTLRFTESYSVADNGIRGDGTVIARPGARLFVTGEVSGDDGPCGAAFRVETLNSVQNP